MDAIGKVGIAGRRTAPRSPAVGIAISLVVGLGLALGLAIAVAVTPVSGGAASEATVTGVVLAAFGVGWASLALSTGRWSSQPQRWARVPGAVLGLVGSAILVAQPGPVALGVLGWVWPPAIAVLAIWILIRVRSELRGVGRWLIVPVVVALLLAALGGAVVTTMSLTAARPSPVGGRMIDVGGRGLYLECHGTGGPAVILQAGLGGSAADWGRVIPEVAARTTVCAYDRAGRGWSDPAPGPQDGAAIAGDLHRLLATAGIPGPYVLVGHSSGGPYQRVFASAYPDDVAGMVLLDAQPADAFTALPAYRSFFTAYRAILTLAPSLARLGLGIGVLGSPSDPTGIATAASLRDELTALPGALAQAAELTSLGDAPLVVLSAGTGQQPGWADAQARLVHLSTDAVHRVIASATHDSLVVGHDAAMSAQAILDVVRAVRSGSAVR